MKKLDYDYCHAAPVLEWMSQKWALVAMMRIEEACRDKTDRGIRFSDLFRTIPHISEKVLLTFISLTNNCAKVKTIDNLLHSQRLLSLK